ncbi:hypothetical protein A2U01_0021619 [Trifolium medium]|uniref:Uncharacterized protein n=2 Tax=Trifolium medium TaxID=97028 RepID=A0A392NNA8_9FABA|nr:hypothetical protein [Trifolium medium]
MSSSQQSSANAPPLVVPPSDIEAQVVVSGSMDARTLISNLWWFVNNLACFVILLLILPTFRFYFSLHGFNVTFKIFLGLLALTMCSIIANLSGFAIFLLLSYKLQQDINNPWFRSCIQCGCLIFFGVYFCIMNGIYMAAATGGTTGVAPPPT